MAEMRFPLKNDMSRKIIHIDMDAFFASVEERDNPELAKHPLVIARHPKDTKGRGVVTTCNYKAREYGIHSAMSAKKAYELCPQAVFVPGNYQKYREISRQIRAIFHRYTDLIEPMSIDEAYLDVTENKIGSKSAIKVARCIQEDIWRELHLTCSAGVSYNKFLAKLASDYRKPHGMTVIMPGEAEAFLKELPHRYYEENNLHMLLVTKIKDYPECLRKVKEFLPYINNWATCDLPAPKCFEKHREELLPVIREWVTSTDTYTIRYGIGILMRLYLDDAYRPEYADLVARVRSEEYYVNMMIAWYFATALAKQWDTVIPYLEERKLDRWVHQKTIQKAVESFRITPEQKVYLKRLRYPKK